MATECNCSMRTQLVGDGCEVCNPEMAAEIQQENDSKTIYPYCPACHTVDSDPLLLDEESVYECASCGEEYMAINNDGNFEFDAFVRP